VADERQSVSGQGHVIDDRIDVVEQDLEGQLGGHGSPAMPDHVEPDASELAD
jgi:hypothetical protein